MTTNTLDNHRRSIRILAALARGNVITKVSWLWDSLEHEYWVDTHIEPHLSHRYASSPERVNKPPLANNRFSVLSIDTIPMLDSVSLAKLITIAGGIVCEGLPNTREERTGYTETSATSAIPHWVVFSDRDDLTNWITIKMKCYDDRKIIRDLLDMMSEGVRVVLAKVSRVTLDYLINQN